MKRDVRFDVGVRHRRMLGGDSRHRSWFKMVNPGIPSIS
jgi:hypothetical protein